MSVQVSPVDIAALARRAGLPSDEPAIREFALLVVAECLKLCGPDARDDLSWIAEHHVGAVADGVTGRIALAFDVDYATSFAGGWFAQTAAALQLVHPEMPADDFHAMLRASWIDRFAARLLERGKVTVTESGEAIATDTLKSDARWLSLEPSQAANQWAT